VKNSRVWRQPILCRLRSGGSQGRPLSAPPVADVRFSNRPFGVKRFQTIHQFSVDAARGLVLLFGIGTKALPSWDSKTRWNNLWGGLAVRRTVGPPWRQMTGHFFAVRLDSRPASKPDLCQNLCKSERRRFPSAVEEVEMHLAAFRISNCLCPPCRALAARNERRKYLVFLLD